MYQNYRGAKYKYLGVYVWVKYTKKQTPTIW